MRRSGCAQGSRIEVDTECVTVSSQVDNSKWLSSNFSPTIGNVIALEQGASISSRSQQPEYGTPRRLRSGYGEMSDGELADLISDGFDSLNAEARHAFEIELRNRGLTEKSSGNNTHQNQSRKKGENQVMAIFMPGGLPLKNSVWPGRHDTGLSSRVPFKTVFARDQFTKASCGRRLSTIIPPNPRSTKAKRSEILSSQLRRIKCAQKYGIGDEVEVRFDPT